MTGLTIGTSAGNKSASSITVGTSSGNKAVLTGYIGTSSGNKLFYTALSAIASPAAVTGTEFGSSSAVVTSDNVGVAVTGGTGATTYAWRRISGDVAISADNVSSSVTSFSATLSVAEDLRIAVFVCDVTRNGITVESNSVTVTLEFNDIYF